MKTLVSSFLFIISSCCIHAQDREVISEKHLYDFCYCDYIGDTLTIGYNEIYEDEINDSLYGCRTNLQQMTILVQKKRYENLSESPI
jgi:hypothetical protein